MENLATGFPVFEMSSNILGKKMLSENDKIVGIKSMCKTNSSGKVKRKILIFCVFGNRVQQMCRNNVMQFIKVIVRGYCLYGRGSRFGHFSHSIF